MNQRYLACLKQLDQITLMDKTSQKQLYPAILQLFTESTVSKIPPNKFEFNPKNTRLNKLQKSTAEHCTCTNDPISVIQGPPGTGKSTVFVEVIYQLAIVLNRRVLVTAQSH